MNCKSFIIVLLTAFMLSACATSSVVSSWKDKSGTLRKYNKILVVGMIKDTSSILRRNMEDHVVSDINRLGYNAVSALNEFGQNGLADLAQEETFRRLCTRGVDAVITIALLDKAKENHHTPTKIKLYPGLYYYDRIWNYKAIQAHQINDTSDVADKTQFVWEIVFFDLNTLSPVYFFQTKSFDAAATKANAHKHAKTISENLVKTKVLSLQTKVVQQGAVKAF